MQSRLRSTLGRKCRGDFPQPVVVVAVDPEAALDASAGRWHLCAGLPAETARAQRNVLGFDPAFAKVFGDMDRKRRCGQQHRGPGGEEIVDLTRGRSRPDGNDETAKPSTGIVN